jgi:hypothetical protein
MKIFENKKENKVRTVKLFGFPIYVDARTKQSREQSFLNGAVTTFCAWESGHKQASEKNIEILNCPFMRIVRDDYFIKEYIGGRFVKSVDLKERFKKRYFKHIDKHDDIYVLNANSGEIYLFLTYVAENFIKRNGSKNPLLVATKKYHIDLIKLLTPEIPYVYVKAMGRDIAYDDVVDIDDKRLFLLFCHKHFEYVERSILNKPVGESYYFVDICNRLNIKAQDLGYKKAVVSGIVQDSMLKKVKKTGLNLDKFVFVAPHARSCEEYDTEFWIELCKKLKEQGFDVFFNVAKGDRDPIRGCKYKTCKLTFSEAFALAQRSKQIVCLRSGLSELLTQADVPLHVIYTKFKNRTSFDEVSVERIFSGFGLKILPNINHTNLKEYNTGEMTEDAILEKIMAGCK